MLTLFWLLMALQPSAVQASQPTPDERLRTINRAHDQALFSGSAPSLVDEMTSQAFLERFARENCKLPPVSNPDPARTAACDAMLKQALVNALATRYFAVDRKEIEARCKREELACMDPRILELWVRNSHNAGIELSRKEKLARLRAR